MTLYKDLQGKIQRLYYAYIKNGYEVDFVTSKIADERFRYFPKIGKIVKFLENIKIDDEEKEFLNIFLDYPFLHCDDFVRYTYIVRQDTDEVNEQFALFNVDLIKAALSISSRESFNDEVLQRRNNYELRKNF